MSRSGSDLSMYDLKSVSLPRISGRLLKLAVRLMESPVTSSLVAKRFFDQIGITALRALPLDDSPTFLPEARQVGKQPTQPPDLERCPDRSEQPPGSGLPAVRDFAAAYRDGRATPLSVAEKLLEAIEASDRALPPLRAFIAVDRDDLMKQAEASTERFRRGKPISLFDGVPVAVKDEMAMTPYATTAGTGFLAGNRALEDSGAVARIRAAGALLVGKTNMHEIGISTLGLNLHHGTPRNPHNPDHYAGGSSGGSAAAVSAGLCPVALGADAGGSIRVPAAFCGVVGCKPTFGRVSAHGGVPLSWSVVQRGPFAGSAEDAALAYGAIAGPDPRDPATLRQPPVTIAGYDRADLDGVTLGVYRPWFEHADRAIVSACTRLLEKFAQVGAKVREIALPELEPMRVAHALTLVAEVAENMRRYAAAHGRDFEPSTRLLLGAARHLTRGDYVQAQRVRTRAMAGIDAAFQEVDAIVTPATAITAPAILADALKAGESNLSVVVETMRYAFPANFCGYPAISFPAGCDEQGMPIGFQAMGRHFEEHLLFRIARAAEPFVERRRPARSFDLLGI